MLPDSIVQLFGEKPKGQFLKDSIQLGEPVAYTLHFDYPKDFQVVFPDTNYNFKPFELSRKQYFPTRSEGNISRDSVVYYLASFELTTPLRFSLPVFIIYQGDSIPYYAPKASVSLKEVISTPVDTLDVQANTTLMPLERQFNYPYLITAFVSILILSLCIFLLFGKRISRYIQLLKLKRKHRVFEERFSRGLQNLQREQNLTHIEQLLSIWKQYLEILEKQPFNSYTSKEIKEAIPIPTLKESLLVIDKAVYGNKIDAKIEAPFIQLKKIATKRFEQQRQRIQEKATS
ncbi:MAG: hypothetical protein ACFB0B_09625 [Thermonemataceae bacterium]